VRTIVGVIGNFAQPLKQMLRLIRQVREGSRVAHEELHGVAAGLLR
jgi:hypothetical protein